VRVDHLDLVERDSSFDDERQLVLGRNLVFTLSHEEDDPVIVRPDGKTGRSKLPWKKDNAFGIAYLEFSKLYRESLPEGPERADFFQNARTLGACCSGCCLMMTMRKS
jgi:hypothetical protein